MEICSKCSKAFGRDTRLACAAVDWSALPGPALDLISARLAAAAADYLHFRSVCSSWRAAAPRRPQLPCLVGHQRDGCGHHTVYTFSGFDGERLLPIAGSFPLGAHLGACFCSSSHGWLALVDRSSYGVFIWNPVTGDRVQLPPIDGFPNKVILSSDPATTSTDCVILLIYGGFERLSFCWLGDDAWTAVEMPPPPFAFSNVDAVFHRGQFYLATGFRIYALDDVGMPAKLEQIPRLQTELPKGLSWSALEFYLLESCEKLLLITLDCSGEKHSAHVFELVWVEDQVMLSKQHDLGGRAAFVGRNNSFSLCANESPLCRRNCIYKVNGSEEFIRVIHLEDSTNELIANNFVDRDTDWRPCAWLTPSLL